MEIVASCTQQPNPALIQQAYIWQRQWTPALQASIIAAHDHFDAWRVLAMEAGPGGEIVDAAPQLEVLARSTRPVVVVARLNGNRPPPSGEELAQHLQGIVAHWRAAGIVVIGVEIDHDCATSQLDRYAVLLAQLRPLLAGDLALSITVLPTWIGAPALPRVLAYADSSVLQVHAISAPQPGQTDAGLFDVKQARRWIDAYGVIVAKPFHVALPAYGLRVSFDDEGRAVAVESEMRRNDNDPRAVELRVAAKDVADLLRGLERTRPAWLVGVVWFRLPSTDDHRAWSLETLQAVIDGAPLQAKLDTRLDAGPAGARDLVLLNSGAIDTPLPALILVHARGCSAADALTGFDVAQQTDELRFARHIETNQSDAILRAGRERHIGWLRCESVDGVTIHEIP